MLFLKFLESISNIFCSCTIVLFDRFVFGFIDQFFCTPVFLLFCHWSRNLLLFGLWNDSSVWSFHYHFNESLFMSFQVLWISYKLANLVSYFLNITDMLCTQDNNFLWRLIPMWLRFSTSLIELCVVPTIKRISDQYCRFTRYKIRLQCPRLLDWQL